MFGNRLVYTSSPGGQRRGLIYQSSNFGGGEEPPIGGWGYPEYDSGILLGGNNSTWITFNVSTFCNLAGLSLMLYKDYAILIREISGVNNNNLICFKEELDWDGEWFPHLLIPIFDLKIGNKVLHSTDLITENEDFKIARENITFDDFNRDDYNIEHSVTSESFTLDCLMFYLNKKYISEYVSGNHTYWRTFSDGFTDEELLYRHRFSNINLKGWKLDWNMQLKVYDCPTPYMFNSSETIDWNFEPYVNTYGAYLTKYVNTVSKHNISQFERAINASSYNRGVCALSTINPHMSFYYKHNNERYLFGNGYPMGIGPIYGYTSGSDWTIDHETFTTNTAGIVKNTGNIETTGLPRECRVSGASFIAHKPEYRHLNSFSLCDLIDFRGYTPLSMAETAGINYHNIESVLDTYWVSRY